MLLLSVVRVTRCQVRVRIKLNARLSKVTTTSFRSSQLTMDPAHVEWVLRRTQPLILDKANACINQTE